MTLISSISSFSEVVAAQRGHVGLGPGFVDEDQASRIDAMLIGHPLLAAARHIRSVALAGDQRLFCNSASPRGRTPRPRDRRRPYSGWCSERTVTPSGGVAWVVHSRAAR